MISFPFFLYKQPEIIRAALGNAFRQLQAFYEYRFRV